MTRLPFCVYAPFTMLIPNSPFPRPVVLHDPPRQQAFALRLVILFTPRSIIQPLLAHRFLRLRRRVHTADVNDANPLKIGMDAPNSINVAAVLETATNASLCKITRLAAIPRCDDVITDFFITLRS